MPNWTSGQGTCGGFSRHKTTERKIRTNWLRLWIAIIANDKRPGEREHDDDRSHFDEIATQWRPPFRWMCKPALRTWEGMTDLRVETSIGAGERGNVGNGFPHPYGKTSWVVRFGISASKSIASHLRLPISLLCWTRSSTLSHSSHWATWVSFGTNHETITMSAHWWGFGSDTRVMIPFDNVWQRVSLGDTFHNTEILSVFILALREVE